MKWLVALLFCIGTAHAQIQQHNISDDGFARVPLPFAFPYYGQVFTESYMFSNGVVGFMSPTNSWCCTGFNLEQSRGPWFNYAIMPLQTDLINYGSGRFRTEGTAQYQRYSWENISEYGAPQNLNTFGVEIRPSGFIGMYYQQVNISAWRPVTIGRTGNTDLGEYHQYYHGSGFNRNQPFEYLTPSTGDMCLVNPLFSPSCPGYEVAYTAQQCSANPLYRPSCPGYEQAYFDQQCTANALYDRRCPNYATAYATQQATSTPTVAVATPSVQVNFTGTVAVETPVVSDPVVNTVVTRQSTTTSSNAIAANTVQNNPVVNNQKQTESKKETKQEVKKEAPKNEVTAAAPQIVQPAYEYKAPIILDPLYRQLVTKPIKDNNRSMYFLIMTSQKKHEEMVDGQWSRKRD